MTKTMTPSRTKPALRHPHTFLVTAGVSLLLFVLLTYAVMASGYFDRLDQRLLTYFSNFQEQAPAWATTVSTWIQNTTSSGLGIIATLLGIIWWLTKRRRWFFLLLAGVGGAELIWWPLLFTIGRPRPETVIIWQSLGGLQLPSYPSGHALINVAFYGTILYIFYPRLNSRTAKTLLLAFCAAILLLAGLNRLFFSVHYLTDVVGGYLVGIAWTTFALWLVEWGLRRKPELTPKSE